MSEHYFAAVVSGASKRKTKIHTSTSSDITGRAISLCGHEVLPTAVPMVAIWTRENTTYDMFCKRCSSSWLDSVPIETLHLIEEILDLQTDPRHDTITA